jgi:hypothetical protein
LLAAAWPALAETLDTTQSRLQQAAIDNGIVLSSDQRMNLLAKCQSAQTRLVRIRQNVDSLVEERVNIYTSIQQELQAIKLRMIRQGADASETDLLTGKIQQSLEDFAKLSADYKLALDDVIAVDCTKQPEYFQAGLIVMRLKRATLLDELTQLNATICNDELFEQLKSRLVI